jgi:hypothetical protein
MNTKKQIAIYLALAIALVLSATQVQAQTVDMGDVADYPVQVEDDDVVDAEMQADPIKKEQKKVLDILIDEQEAQDAVEKATQETEMALEQQEEELAHDTEMSRKIERQAAEMEAYLKSQ